MDINAISFEEKQRIYERAMKNQLDHRINEMVENQIYEIKKYTVCSFYRRLSSEQKVRLLSNFLIDTDQNSVITIIWQLSQMIKLSCYSLIQSGTDFSFDKVLHDHDRALEEPALSHNMSGCVNWFKTLNLRRRSEVTSDMLLSTSGSVLYRILMPMRRMHNFHLASFPAKIAGERSNLEISYETEADRARPECVEVERLRKKWHEALTKYRADVHKAALESSNMAIKNATDMIQFLPVWIVKKIFSHFDKKTMEVAKQVNSYWSKTISDLQEELKTREFLNKKLNIMKESIDPVKLKAAKREMEEKYLKRRRRFRFETGAIARCLRRQIPKRCYEGGIYTRILNKIYSDQEGELQVFPRCVCEHKKLDKYVPSSLQDIDVKIGDGRAKQTSFLSYQCSVESTSLKSSILASDVLRAEW